MRTGVRKGRAAATTHMGSRGRHQQFRPWGERSPAKCMCLAVRPAELAPLPQPMCGVCTNPHAQSIGTPTGEGSRPAGIPHSAFPSCTVGQGHASSSHAVGQAVQREEGQGEQDPAADEGAGARHKHESTVHGRQSRAAGGPDSQTCGHSKATVVKTLTTMLSLTVIRQRLRGCRPCTQHCAPSGSGSLMPVPRGRHS